MAARVFFLQSLKLWTGAQRVLIIETNNHEIDISPLRISILEDKKRF
jgi:hypothetical protein